MRALNSLAWIIAIVAVALVAAKWHQIRWYLSNQKMVDQAIDTAESLQQVGVL
jgi:hypothetical protein